MPKLTIHVPSSIKIPADEMRSFETFLQRISNRRALGSLRYGRIRAEQKYMTRLGEEYKAYKRSGNAEQLLNIAVYAFLESYAPENAKNHFDPTAESVTRRRHGGNIA